MNVFKTIRNHWKKTVFFSGVLAYGASYGYDKYRINALMRSCCAEAVVYGNSQLLPEAQNRKVIVILNPTANKKSAESNFEKYCGPILHLAGIRVDIVKTESEGFARNYVETQLRDLPDAILVAGGDGTLSEVVTGLLRRSQGDSCPVGILPVGRTNSVATRIFPTESGKVEVVRGLTNAAMSVVRGQVAKKDILKIELLPEQEDDPEASPKKPIYAMASIKWGAFRDAMTLRDKYWYYFGVRDKAAIFFNAFKSTVLNWDCRALMITTPPCPGCANCCAGYEKQNTLPEYKGRNWFSFLVPKSSGKKELLSEFIIDGVDIRTRLNPECNVKTETELTDVNELFLTTSNLESMESPPPHLNLRLGSAKVSALDWIQDSWGRTTDELNSKILNTKLNVRTMELIPERRVKEAKDKEEFYSIDNEDYEVKPIRVTLLPGHINMFT